MLSSACIGLTMFFGVISWFQVLGKTNIHDGQVIDVIFFFLEMEQSRGSCNLEHETLVQTIAFF